MNYVMGIPYKSDADLVGEGDFKACYLRNPGWQMQDRRPNGIVRVSIGIDWGDISYYIVLGWDSSGRRYLLKLGYVQKVHGEPLADAKEIARIIKPFVPDIIVADLGYGKDSNAFC